MQRISTITICFNNLAELIETMASVDMQAVLPFEHLIIDGSTNGDIRNWLESHPQPDWRRWICEPDRGISDAFNKGIRNAKGEIIHLLNSGDAYFDGEVLKLVTTVFESHPETQWLHGRFVQCRAGLWVESGVPFSKDLLYKGMRTVGHPTMFIHKELYKIHGLFSLEKKIAMDYDFLLRIRDEPFYYLARPLVKFAPEGVSNQNIEAGLAEVTESYNRLIGSNPKQKLWMARIRLLHKLTGTRLGRMLFKIKNRKKANNPQKS